MKSFLKTIILILFTNFNLFAQTNADFSSNVTSGCSPLSVKFTNLSTGNPTSFYWNFGNGQTSVKINPSATYLNPGSYTVILKVSDANGTNTITKTNFITV
ncbi:MAG: PKD domain-containing protein, partial [Bacteroidota bacterium]|nr:PKD domain-containing protein [Bacteroidota bacterium]